MSASQPSLIMWVWMSMTGMGPILWMRIWGGHYIETPLPDRLR
jgi:hypothetical protein